MLRPDRVRTLSGTPFGWLDARLLHRGWLRALCPEATAAYAFLCLVADREGVSFYRRERIARELGLCETRLHQALRQLEALDLVAYRPFRAGAAEGFRQVLALPTTRPPATLLPPDLAQLLSDATRPLP